MKTLDEYLPTLYMKVVVYALFRHRDFILNHRSSFGLERLILSSVNSNGFTRPNLLHSLTVAGEDLQFARAAVHAEVLDGTCQHLVGIVPSVDAVQRWVEQFIASFDACV